MKRAIIKSKDRKQYFFCDDPEWEVDYKKYIDKIQNENELPHGKYIVTYFKRCDDASGLEQLVDYGITKEQIVENVNAQKYVEGADYFLVEQLRTIF